MAKNANSRHRSGALSLDIAAGIAQSQLRLPIPFQYVANKAIMVALYVNPSYQNERALSRSIAELNCSAAENAPDLRTVNRTHGVVVRARMAHGAMRRFQETRCTSKGLTRNSRSNGGANSILNPPAKPRTKAAVLN